MKTKPFQLLSLAVFAIFILVGCAGNQIKISEAITPEMQELGVNTVGFAVGMAVARAPEWVDVSLRETYRLVKDGRIDAMAINDLVIKLTKTDDLAVQALANRLIKLVEKLGGVVEDGLVLSIDGISPNLLDELGDGYVDGYDLAKSNNDQASFALSLEVGVI